jgi:hypothetical protein
MQSGANQYRLPVDPPELLQLPYNLPLYPIVLLSLHGNRVNLEKCLD